MLWVDKYRPHTLDELELYPELTGTLRHLAASQDIPHLLFYGPSGSGRKTRAMSLLHQVYGPSVYSLHLEHKSIPVSDSKVVDMPLLTSPHHLDINPSDAGYYDRVIVMQMIKEIAQTAPLLQQQIGAKGLFKGDGGAGGSGKSSGSSRLPSGIGAHRHSLKEEEEEGQRDGSLHANSPSTSTAGNPGSSSISTTRSTIPYKVVILNEVDKMTKNAQHALRRTMEKYMSTCRLILICSSLSRLIPPLQSRCLAIRVPSHSQENLETAVKVVCLGEKLPSPSASFLSFLHQRCEGNLRRGLLMLEASAMNGVDLRGTGSDIPLPDWKLYLQDVVDCMIAEQSPKVLYDIRKMFYDVLAQCISGETIFREVVDCLIGSSVPVALHGDIFQLAAKYEFNMRIGTKPIVHLEAFTAAVMQVLKAGKVPLTM